MWEMLGALLVGTVVSGVVPFVNAEILVISAAAVAPWIGVPLVAAVATFGQMSSKTALFGLARWAPAKLPGKARTRLEKASEAVNSRDRTASSLIFLSASLGFPPFYGVSLACGALKVPIQTFVLIGSAGRGLRFGVLAWLAARFGSQAIDFFTILIFHPATVFG